MDRRHRRRIRVSGLAHRFRRVQTIPGSLLLRTAFSASGAALFAPAVSFDTTANISVFKLGLSFTLPDEWDPQRSRSSPRW